MDTNYFMKRFSLDGKKAIVTGSSGGIGRAIAVSLARFGAEVAVLGRSEEKLQDTKNEIESFGGIVETYAFDVSSSKDTDAFFETYVSRHGAPDIFVANAGSTVISHVQDTTDEQMEHLLGTDFKGAVYGLRQAGNLMKEQRSGNIVIVTSVNALFAYPDQAIYSGIKAAMENIMRSMASDLGRYNVRVNTLAPGAVNTDLCGPHKEHGFRSPDIPLGYQAEPDQMGDVVACMVSEPFNYMTGSTVLVDGGLMLRPTKY